MIAFLTVFMLMFNVIPFTAYAAESVNYITVNEFQERRNDLYSKYESSFVILDTNDAQYIPLEYAEELYERVALAFEEKAMQEAVQNEAIFEDSKISNQKDANSSRLIMSIPYYALDAFMVLR